MAASFSTLASELVLCLIPFLNGADLSRLSRSCRALHRVALQYIYEDITWEYNVHGRTSPAHLLLRTLSERPEYGSFVKHISFQCQPNAPHYEAVLGSPLFLPDSFIATIEYHIPQPHKHLPDLWRHQIVNGDSGACVAMILAFLPVLETLCLDSFFIDYRCLAGVFATPNSFLKLHQLLLDGDAFGQCGYPNDGRLWHWRYFLRLFDLPNLVDVAIDFPAMPHGRLPLPPESPGLRSLTVLRLPRCHSPPSVLEYILKSSPPLKLLVYTYNAPKIELVRIDKQMVDLTSLSRAIAHVSKTLRSLCLGVHFAAALSLLDLPVMVNGPFQGTTMNVKQCEQLEELAIPLMMLTDWHSAGDLSLTSKLPTTLEMLSLRDKEMAWRGCHMTPMRLVRMIRKLLEEKANGTREAFETLGIQTWSENVGWRRQDLLLLEHFCRIGGVKTVFRVSTPSAEAQMRRLGH